MGMFTYNCVKCNKTMKLGDQIFLIFFKDNHIVKISSGFNDYYGLSDEWKEGEWIKICNEIFNKDAKSGLSCYCLNCFENTKTDLLLCNLINSIGHQNFTDGWI